MSCARLSAAGRRTRYSSEVMSRSCANMPLTPVGKIYKPALRVLAAKRGIEEAFAKIRIAPSDYRLNVERRRRD